MGDCGGGACNACDCGVGDRNACDGNLTDCIVGICDATVGAVLSRMFPPDLIPSACDGVSWPPAISFGADARCGDDFIGTDVLDEGFADEGSPCNDSLGEDHVRFFVSGG